MNAMKKNARAKRSNERRIGRIRNTPKRTKGRKGNARLNPHVLSDPPPTSVGGHNG